MTSRQSRSTSKQPLSRRRTLRKGEAIKAKKPARRPAGVMLAGDPSPVGIYLNRELTWLEFNWRVLRQAEDDRTPLLERLKFVAIVGSNLDEFFMKRIGGLKQLVGAGVQDLTVDGRSAQQQIDECHAVCRRLATRTQEVLGELRHVLRERGVVDLTRYRALTAEQQKTVREDYIKNVFPLVTPQARDPAHPFPFISNLSLNLLVSLVQRPSDPKPALARVKVPVGSGIPRFLSVRDTELPTFVALEEVMAQNLDLLFPGMEVNACEAFRVTRNANTEKEEEQADDLLALIETELRERQFAPVVRLQVHKTMLPDHRGLLASEMGLDVHTDVFGEEEMLGLRDLMELAGLDIPEHRYAPHHPIDHPHLTPNRNIFHVIRDAGSILLHHPYESFTTSVERFLREASEDPKVLAIKMTLYRTSEKSQVIEHLIEAARNGKQVAVVVELKARFDEAANIRWAARLEEVGIHVSYGVLGLKTHCKVILVVRKDYTGLKRYAHLGTGNYHAGTARAYSDLGLLTADDDLGADLTELFNYLTTGYKPSRQYRKLLPAPKILKKALLGHIDREIQHAKARRSALIQMKMNALEDVDIVRALYAASAAGVKVDLLVRDTCRLRPGVPGLSDNIRVISIVGRFLEHCRLYYFKNGGAEEYYIGSADCMKRNLESRVESVFPVEASSHRAELRLFLDLQLEDQRCGWDMQPDGAYVQRMPPTDGGRASRSSHERLIEHADKRHRHAMRLRYRKPRGLGQGLGR